MAGGRGRSLQPLTAIVRKAGRLEDSIPAPGFAT